MKARNFCALPPVALASSAAEASGVWIGGSRRREHEVELAQAQVEKAPLVAVVDRQRCQRQRDRDERPDHERGRRGARGPGWPLEVQAGARGALADLRLRCTGRVFARRHGTASLEPPVRCERLPVHGHGKAYPSVRLARGCELLYPRCWLALGGARPRFQGGWVEQARDRFSPCARSRGCVRGVPGARGSPARLPVGGASAAGCGGFENPCSQETSQQFGYGSVQRQDTPNDPDYDQSEPDTAQPPANRSSNFFDERFDLFGFPSQLTPNAIYAVGPHAGKPMVAGLQRGRRLEGRARSTRRRRRDPRHGHRLERARPARPDPPQHRRAALPGARRRVLVRDLRLQRRRRGQRRGLRERPAREPLLRRPHGPAGLITGQDLIHAFGDCQIDASTHADRAVRRAASTSTTTATASPTTSPAGTSSTTTTNPPTCRATSPPHHHGTGRALDAVEQGNDGAGLDRRLPALPGHADTHLGHVRLRRQHVRARHPLRDRQRRQGDRGRQRQPLPLGLRRVGLAVRLRPRRRADLLRRRPEHRQPQLPGQLRPRDADPGHGRRQRSASAKNRASGSKARSSAASAGSRRASARTSRSSTFFRGANTTQYGGKSSISMEGPTGSVNTSKAAGAAALVVSAGLDHGVALRPDETRELLEQTAERVLTGNTAGAGVPDPGADPTLPPDEQWTSHFGWGRADVGAAVGAVAERRHPAGGGDRLPRLVRAADRLERRDHRPRAGALRRPAASFHWKLMWGAGRGAVLLDDRCAKATPAARSPTSARSTSTAVRSALASYVVPPDPGGPTFAADEPNPFQHEFTVQLEVSGQGIPLTGHRPPRVRHLHRPDARAGLPQAHRHRRRIADPLRRPQRRQRPGADRPDRGRRWSTPTSRTARSCAAGPCRPTPSRRRWATRARPASRRSGCRASHRAGR